MSLIFKPENHEYFFNGVKTPGVTATLGASIKSFYGPEADTARQFGSALHKTIAMLEQGKKISFDPQLTPYLKQWERFKNSKPDHKILLIEEKLYSKKYQYAGTPDFLIKDRRGDLILIDIKTGAKTPLWELQIAAYCQLLVEAGRRPRFAYCIKLEPEGFKLFDFSRGLSLNFTIFLSFLNVAKWKLKNNIV